MGSGGDGRAVSERKSEMASPTSEVLKMGTATSPARLSFARLYTPKPFEPGQKPRFEATFLLDPSNAEHKKQIDAIKVAAKKLIVDAGLDPTEFRLCFGSGDKKKYDGYKGMVYLASANTTRPTVVNRRREPVAETDPGAPYSGCYVIGSVTLWLNTKKSKWINANLRAVQFVKDGERFGGAAPVDADAEFEALEDGDAPATAGADDDFFNT